jgi:small subunit ribosomal protein S2
MARVKKIKESEESDIEARIGLKSKKPASDEIEESEKTEEEDEKTIPERNVRDEEELKQKKKEFGELIVPIEDYLKCGVYIGTKIIMPGMRKYVYKKRADGLGILNAKLIDEKLRAAADMLAQFAPEQINIICKREAGWKALEHFSKITGIKCFLKKYPAGIITNLNLQEFFEPSIFLIADPWLDKNAMLDAVKIGIPIIGLCDTNNLTKYMDLVVPCNNKSDKSLGLIFWVLCNEYVKKRKIDVKMPPLEKFTGPIEALDSSSRQF